MPEDTTTVQELRDQIARLITENLRLQERLREAERERNEVAVPAIAAALVRSIHEAEEAMAVEASGGVSYAIPELEVTLRGYVSQREEAVLLHLPRPELSIPPEHLGTVRMTAASIPGT